MKLYLSAHQQLKGMVDSGALVQQKGFKFHLLHIVERVENDCQKLEWETKESRVAQETSQLRGDAADEDDGISPKYPNCANEPFDKTHSSIL